MPDLLTNFDKQKSYEKTNEYNESLPLLSNLQRVPNLTDDWGSIRVILQKHVRPSLTRKNKKKKKRKGY